MSSLEIQKVLKQSLVTDQKLLISGTCSYYLQYLVCELLLPLLFVYLVEGFRSLESAVMSIWHRINQNKTKYMAMNARRLLDPLILETGPYTFEHVHTFTYLVTKINKENDITE
jgi:hypothetical protein